MKKSIMILVVFIIILFIFLNKKIESTKPSINPQEVFLSDKITDMKVTSKQQPKKLNQIENEVDDFDKKLELDNKDKQLSYLMTFRDYYYFEICKEIVVSLNNNQDPQLIFDKQQFRFFGDISFPNSTQKHYFSIHLQKCEHLMQDDQESYDSARSRLWEVFNNQKPVTQNEKDIAYFFELQEQHTDIVRQHSRAQSGSSKLSPDKLKAIRTQIKLLNNQNNAILYSGQIDEQQKREMQLLTNKVNELKAIISENLVLNKGLIQDINNRHQNIDKKIDDLFINSNSPDVFYHSAKILLESKSTSKQRTKVKNTLQIYEHYLTDILNKSTFPLVACSLGFPCNPESRFVLEYCLGINQLITKQACGINLEDFYFSGYLSPNQLTDVSNYFNYLTKNYAQN